MTDAELEELERLLSKATPGVWEDKSPDEGENLAFIAAGEASVIAACGCCDGPWVKKADRDFIVASKTAMGAMASTIRALKSELEKRDRVVEAARFARTLLAGLKAFRDDGDLQVMGDALQRLEVALSALDQEGTP
ncbi:hypothetical protein [Oceanicaulis sp.]|uniref:hypothetical protein n=1 Tax=Oceanicaulis sp. TaxID=1924941 RepID=UPI003D2D8729